VEFVGIELRQLYLSPKVVKQFNTLEISTTAIFQLLHLTIKLTSSNKEVDFPKEFNNVLCWQRKRVLFGRVGSTEA